MDGALCVMFVFMQALLDMTQSLVDRFDKTDA
jgi:hypothetical protein